MSDMSDHGDDERDETRSAGRGMLVDEDLAEAKREAMAQVMEATLREKRRSEWTPE